MAMECKRVNGLEQARLKQFQDDHQLEYIPLCERGSDRGETVYLEAGDQIVGIASITRNAFHPQFDHLYFAVKEYDLKLLTGLFQHLNELRSTACTPLQMLVNQTDVDSLLPFVDRYGFTRTLNCDCPRIHVTNSMERLNVSALPAEYSLQRYSDLDASLKTALQNFRVAGYIKTHFWSPPVTIDHPLWKETAPNAEDEVICWVVWDGDQIVLCSEAHLEDDEVWLGWGWHDDRYENSPLEDLVWKHVLMKQLSYCQTHDKRLFGEFDSLDPYAQIKSRLLVHQAQNTCCIFQQRNRHQLSRTRD